MTFIMLRLPFPGVPILRRLLAFLLALAPLGAPSAAVTINGHMGGSLGDVSCANASSMSYDLDQNVFAFHCGTNALNYSCTPTGVDYATGTQIIELKKFLGITQHALDPLLKV